MLFSLGRMCFECTLLFKIFIRFIHFTFCVGVLATCMSVCHVGAWCHRRPEEGTALAVWLWVVVNQHGKEGWNHSSGVESASVCMLGSCFSPSIRIGSGGRRKLPLSFLSPFSVRVSNKIPSVGWCPQHSWYVVFPLSVISGNTPSCLPPSGQCLLCVLI